MTDAVAVERAGQEVDQRSPGGVSDLRKVIGDLDRQREALAERGDLDTLAFGLADMKVIAKDLRTLIEATEADVANMLPQKTWEVEGLGVLERKTSVARTKWQWETLWPLLVRQALDPEGDGELPPLPVIVASFTSLVEQVIGLTGSKGPRLTALRAMGHDPDEWCELGRQRVSVQFHGATEK